MTYDDNYAGRTEVERWIKRLETKRQAENTKKKHRSNLKRALEYLNKDPMEITKEDVENWEYEMAIVRGYKKATIRHNLFILRKFLKWLGHEENFLGRIEIPEGGRKEEPKEEIWLTEEEEEAMIKSSAEMGLRMEAIIRLFLSSGIRVGELRNIELEDIDFDNRTINIRPAVSKMKRSETVFFNEDTKRSLLLYLKTRIGSKPGQPDYVFTGKSGNNLSYNYILKIVKECAIRADITKKISCHALRHTFITRTYERTGDPYFSKRVGRHRDLQTNLIYQHETKDTTLEKYNKYMNNKNENEEHKPVVNTKGAEDQISDKDTLKILGKKLALGQISEENFNLLKSVYLNDEVSGKQKKSTNFDINYR